MSWRRSSHTVDTKLSKVLRARSVNNEPHLWLHFKQTKKILNAAIFREMTMPVAYNMALHRWPWNPTEVEELVQLT
jgi:hypothetical protein